MAGKASLDELDRATWAHVEAERFAEAEVTLRTLIEQVDPENHAVLWTNYGLLGGVLNRLDRPDEGTEMFRRSLAEAEKDGHSSVVESARYILANQYVLFGDPRDALEAAEPIPPGTGHIQCLLGAVVAEALWKLQRHDEARAAAQRAIDACPTDERRTQLTEQLGHILGS